MFKNPSLTNNSTLEKDFFFINFPYMASQNIYIIQKKKNQFSSIEKLTTVML